MLHAIDSIPSSLIEEMINYLYSSGISNYKGFKAINHIDFSIFPIPLYKTYFDKAKFYNIAIQKIVANFAYRNYEEVVVLAEKYLLDTKVNSHVKIARNIATQYSEKNDFKGRLSTFLVSENEFSIDKQKKFVYLTNTNVTPNQIQLADNQFYQTFSKKYPTFFKLPDDISKVFHYEKTCTSQDSSEALSEALVLAMRTFAADIDQSEVNFRNRHILDQHKQQIEAAKAENPEGPDPSQSIPAPVLLTTLPNPTNYSEAMILFICKESEEINKQEQFSLMNDLLNKQ